MEECGEKGLISIIVPAYNAGAFLDETIATVKAQSYERWEMLIANDGSTDNTVEIAQEAAAEDSRVRLYHVEPGKTGLAARARNLAMKHAKGEFFAFLDADDKWHVHKLERQVEFLNSHPNAGGVCTWSDVFGFEERLRRGRRTNRMAPVVRKKEFYKSVSPCTTPSLMFCRRCYETIGGMDEDSRLVTGEDGEFLLRLVSNYEIYRIREVLTYVRLAPLKNSLSSAHITSWNERGWQVLEVMVEKGLFTPDESRRRISHLYYQQALDNLFYLNAPFRRYLLRSIFSGHPPAKAVVMLSLSFLPASLLWRVLIWLDKVFRILLYRRFRRKPTKAKT